MLTKKYTIQRLLAILFIASFLMAGFWLLFVTPAHAIEINVITSPDKVIEDESVAAYIVRLYWFAVGAAGIVAVAVIVGGGIYYMTSSGSPDKQNEAKSYITSALWGIVLLLGSYFILNTINPQITTLELPGANLPSCSGMPGGEPGVDCLPDVPEILPICTEGQSPCGIGEEEGTDGCVECRQILGDEEEEE